MEDDPDDVDLTLRALGKYNVRNEVAVVRDGAEALDYLFGTGGYADRNTIAMPALILPDLGLLKLDGLELLRHIPANERAGLLR